MVSVEAMTWALDVTEVRGTEKLVLLGIANHADKHGGNAWPSVETLARYAGVHERGVQRAIEALIQRGLVVRHLNAGGSRKQRPDRAPNLYELDLSRGGARATPLPTHGVARGTARGGAQRANGVVHAPPKPSIEPSTEPSLLPAAAPPDPPNPAKAILMEWWTGQDPRPAQPFPAALQVCQRALGNGWTADELRAALPELPTISGAALDFWRKRRRPAAAPFKPAFKTYGTRSPT